MMWPDYGWLRRYRPGRTFGWLQVSYAPDHWPWPQVGAYRSGDRLTLSFCLGPLGPDPAVSFDLTIPRPRALSR